MQIRILARVKQPKNHTSRICEKYLTENIYKVLHTDCNEILPVDIEYQNILLHEMVSKIIILELTYCDKKKKKNATQKSVWRKNWPHFQHFFSVKKMPYHFIHAIKITFENVQITYCFSPWIYRMFHKSHLKKHTKN